VKEEAVVCSEAPLSDSSIYIQGEIAKLNPIKKCTDALKIGNAIWKLHTTVLFAS
jgi:hypothetical protein